MKKGIGCLVLILVLLLITVLKSKTGVTHGGTGLIGTGILVGLVMFGWSLIKSKKDDSYTNNQINSKDDNSFAPSNDTDNVIVNKQNKQSSSNDLNIQINAPSSESNTEFNKSSVNNDVKEKLKILENKVKEGFKNKDESIISSFDEKIKNIEIQYKKGVFTEDEKDSLIDNLTIRKEDVLDKIHNVKIVDILNNHRVLYETELERELSKINDLYNDGLLTKEMLKEKNEKIKHITALEVQKKLIIETNKATISIGKIFVVNDLKFLVVEVIDQNRIKLIQLDDFSQQLIIDINTIEGKNSKSYTLLDIQFDVFKYKFEIDNFLFIEAGQDKPISIGDLIDDGVVFSILGNEILLFKRANNSLNHIDSYFYSGYEKFKLEEKEGWRIPYIWSLKKYVEYCKERYIDLPNILWSSEDSDFTTSKVMTVSKYPLRDYKTISKESNAWGILIKSIPNFNN